MVCVLPLFKIDDRKVKVVIKDAVGAKSGDFDGQKMLCGTTVNPVVVINNFSNLKKIDRTSVWVNPETWFPMGDDYSLKKVVSVAVKQTNTETNAKNIQLVVENNVGDEYNYTLALANNTLNYFEIRSDYHSTDEFQAGTTVPLLGYYESLFCKKLRLVFTSDPGTAQTLNVRIWYYE